MALPINVEDLLSATTIESDRIEYKSGWNPDAIYRSICAFANDFDNLGGGYILIGVDEDNTTKTAVRPVKGLSTSEIAGIQTKMIGFNNLISPIYHPHFFIETVDNKSIIVLWNPGGASRPYEVPDVITSKTKNYCSYIRKYANSIKADTSVKQELISLANKVPFDDRSNTNTSVSEISMVLIQDHLRKIKSRLADEVGKRANIEILQQMELVSGPPERLFPRNVALMVFNENPEKFFPRSQVEIVYFPNGAKDPTFKEYPKITGPVQTQIEKVLEFLQTNFIEEQVTKVKNKAKSDRIFNYPYSALEEAVANALFHRDYEVFEPVEIRIYPDSIIILNYGGPDRSIRLGAFKTGRISARRYRNRRIGDFLKELNLTEGKATGIPTILHALEENGSPAPHFETDDDRSYFQVELFIHPSFKQKLKVETKSTTDTVPMKLLLANDKLEELINNVQNRRDIGRDRVRDIVGDIAGDIDKNIPLSFIVETIDSITSKEQIVIEGCEKEKSRTEMMKLINITNNVKNYNTYISPLLQLEWLEMTIPDKPSSPKQKYRTTLKGMILLEFFNYKARKRN